MVADLADEGLHSKVDLRVLAKVRLGGEARSTLRAHMRLRLVKRRVSPVSRLWRGEQCERGVLRL